MWNGLRAKAQELGSHAAVGIVPLEQRGTCVRRGERSLDGALVRRFPREGDDGADAGERDGKRDVLVCGGEIPDEDAACRWKDDLLWCFCRVV